MPPLKGTVILISSVLFSCRSWISVGVIAKYSLSVRLRFTPQTSLVKRFFAVYNRRVQRAFFFKTTKKRKVVKKQVDDPVGPGSPAARKKKQKSVPSPEDQEKKKKDRKGEAPRRMLQERRQYDKMVTKAYLARHIKDAYKEKLQEAIKNRVACY